MSEKALDPYSYEFESKLLKAIKKLGGSVTVGDVSSETGLPYEQTEVGLRQMLSNYESNIDVDDSGNLRYRFRQPMERRDGKSRVIWHNIKEWTITAVRWVFKVSTMVILVVYTVAFILLLVGIILVASSTGRDENSDTRYRNSGFANLIYYLLVKIVDYIFWFQIVDLRRFDDDQDDDLIEENTYARVHTSDAPFYEKVNRFVFGKEEEKESEEEKNREFAQFVRSRRGVISAADWSEHTGLSLDDADSALTAGITRFAGDVLVTPDGTLLYKFDEMKITAKDAKHHSDTKYFQSIWQKPHEIPKFTGNSTLANIGIAVMGIFVALMSAFSLFELAPEFETNYPDDFSSIILFKYVLGWVPLVYCAFFFLTPIIRAIFFPSKIKKAKAASSRAQGIKRIWTATKNGHSSKVNLEQYDDKKLALDFDGELAIDEGSPTVYTFETVTTQRFAADTARKSSEKQTVFGKTIYSSDETAYNQHQEELDDFDSQLVPDSSNNLASEEKVMSSKNDVSYTSAPADLDEALCSNDTSDKEEDIFDIDRAAELDAILSKNSDNETADKAEVVEQSTKSK